jgi:serine/threonine protein kinase/tetratricopeptide (TPR) repeat protein
MPDSRWSRMRELFERVRDLPSDERGPVLEAELPDDPVLRAEVQALLESNDAAAGFLAERPAPGAGSMVGPYRLIEPIGEGGFGVVYLAEQLRPIKRRVALKLIKPGMDTKQVIARFEAERQALALMDHPGIAQVFEAGETEAGRPYFAMEYVPGEAITAYADARRLGLRRRLELFLEVCDAIQHAHQKGVIHRDIKPSNILVTERDGEAALKIIDFGIAKATGETAFGSDTLSGEGTMVGTAGYMSPEQVGAIGAPVDTRSDIYSLGVLLYELLAGELPIDRERLRRASRLDAMQLLLADPTPPAVRAARTASAEVAERRSTDSRTLLRSLKGELEWITLRALEREPDRRYPSASEFAADVRRYLDDEPVLAAAPGTLYRVQKYARRHRGGVAAAALVLLAILAGVVAAGIGFGRAVKAERVARREAETATQVADFLVDLFHASSPGGSDDSLTVRSLLDQGVRRLAEAPPADVRVHARLLGAISDSYLNLEFYDEGLRLTQQALALVEAAEPGDNVLVAQYVDKVANAFSMAGMPDSVPPLVDRAIGLLSATPGGDPRLLASCLYRMGRHRMNLGDLAAADSLIAGALAAMATLPNPDPARLTRIHGTRGDIASWRYEFDAALADFRQALTYSMDAGEPMRTAMIHRALASTFIGLQEGDSALAHARIAVDMARDLYEPGHGQVAMALSGLAEVYAFLERYPEAVAAQEETIRLLRARELRGDQLPFALAMLGGFHQAEGRVDLAIARTAESVALFRTILGPDHFRVGEATANLARYEMQAGNLAAADTLFRSAIALFEAIDERSIVSPLARQDYANLCLDLGRLEEAGRLYAAADAALDSSNAAMRPYVGDNLIGRARLEARQGRHAEAVDLLADGFRIRHEDLPPDDPSLIDPWLCRAEVRLLSGDEAGSLEDLGQAARCGATQADAARFPELAVLRNRPGYPFVSSP